MTQQPLTLLEGARDGTLLAAAGFGFTGRATFAGIAATAGLLFALGHIWRHWTQAETARSGGT